MEATPLAADFALTTELESARARIERLENENDRLRLSRDRVSEQLNVLDRQLAGAEHRTMVLEGNWRKEKDRLLTQVKELNRKNSNLRHRDSLMVHDARKVERENEKVRERLRGLLGPQRSVRPNLTATRNRGVTKAESKVGEGRIIDVLAVRGLEERNAQLLEENSKLSKSFEKLKSQMAQVEEEKRRRSQRERVIKDDAEMKLKEALTERANLLVRIDSLVKEIQDKRKSFADEQDEESSRAPRELPSTPIEDGSSPVEGAAEEAGVEDQSNEKESDISTVEEGVDSTLSDVVIKEGGESDVPKSTVKFEDPSFSESPLLVRGFESEEGEVEEHLRPAKSRAAWWERPAKPSEASSNRRAGTLRATRSTTRKEQA